jgi:hypothetical protein
MGRRYRRPDNQGDAGDEQHPQEMRHPPAQGMRHEFHLPTGSLCCQTPEGMIRCYRHDLFKGRNIDFDPELHVRFGKVAFGQLSVQVRGDIGRPRIVEGVPVAANIQRGAKMIL